MSDLLKEQAQVLILLAYGHTARHQNLALISTIDNRQLKGISEISHNVLMGSVKPTTSEKKKLKGMLTVSEI